MKGGGGRVFSSQSWVCIASSCYNGSRLAGRTPSGAHLWWVKHVALWVSVSYIMHSFLEVNSGQLGFWLKSVGTTFLFNNMSSEWTPAHFLELFQQWPLGEFPVDIFLVRPDGAPINFPQNLSSPSIQLSGKFCGLPRRWFSAFYTWPIDSEQTLGQNNPDVFFIIW